MTLVVSGLSRRYGSEAALAGIDMAVADGEFLALLGPSGAGKTTLLRLIAGLDRPDSGAILINGVDAGALAPRERRIGFVFQNYALFRHMTVARNIAFGLSVLPRRQRPPRARIAERVAELLGLMQLSGLGDRFPAQLSGGQRQRVALARALAIDPQVLLLDEPFGALDAKVRSELREWLRDLQRTLGLTTVFVTHDQHEAFQLADRVAILNAGHLEQIGSPADLRKHPATPFVRAFLGAADERSGRSPSPAALEAIPDAPRPPAAFDPSVFVVARRGPTAPPQGSGGDAAAGRGPSWTPSVVGVLPDVDPSADLPAVAAGELWLIALPGAGSEPTSLERDALTRANIIVYDRGLADVVAEVMPLGGYAEPTDGDGLARSLQFIRDGWSVVRLIEQPLSDDPSIRFGALGRRLREAGAFPDWRLRRLFEKDGRWLCSDDKRLGNADQLSGHSPNGTRNTIVVSISEGTAPARYAVVSDGLAG